MTSHPNEEPSHPAPTATLLILPVLLFRALIATGGVMT